MGRRRPKGKPGAAHSRPEAGKAGQTEAREMRTGSAFPIEEEIDLHGLAIDEAMVMVEQALARWRHRPGACIRIIHGQSSGSRDSIKGRLRRNLESQWKNRIGSFRPELGNAGSTLVFLPARAIP